MARGLLSTRHHGLRRWAALPAIIKGASREVRGSEYHRSRQVRVVAIAHPNKPMHPTRDTTAVKFLQWLGRAGDWRR